MNKTIITLTVLAALSSNAFAVGEIAVTGNSNTTQTPDASLDKSNHAIQDNVSTVNGTTIDPSITNQYTDSSNRSASANGGTYTTGALTAQGGSNGDQTATTGASTATNGNNSLSTGSQSSSIGDTSLTGGTHSATTGAVTNKLGQQTTATTGSVSNGDTKLSTRNSNSASQGQSARTGSNTSHTTVDAADRSVTNYKSLALVIPSIQATPASTVAVGNIVKETMTCGALQSVQRDSVKGTYIGLFKSKSVDLGSDDTLQPFIDKNGEEQMFKTILGADGRVWVVGHQPVITWTVLAVSGNRNLNLGGGSNDQAFGQAGLGSSSAMTRMVSKVQLRECVYGVLEPQSSILKVRG